MSAEGKVLTVTYGLFSCTLKGFDDPFDVMRAVTLLIEEIAARNPDFGSHRESTPPELLSELAEAAQVQVTQEEGATVLSPVASTMDDKLDRIRSALEAPVARPAPPPLAEPVPAPQRDFPSDAVAPAPLDPEPTPAPPVQPTVFAEPVVEDPSEQVLLDAKEELARELAKIEAEIVEERAKQDRLRAEREALESEDLIGAEPEVAEDLPDAPMVAPEPEVAEDPEDEDEDEVITSAPAAEESPEDEPFMTPDPGPILGDTSVTRILEQTNWEMDKPEGNRRRSAIAHLRAAVAATRADRLLGQDAEVAREEAYREDLEDAVRPHQRTGTDDSLALDVVHDELDPGPAPAPQAAPAVRPAPLKLVAEQRVDEADLSDFEDLPPPKAPLRMRRAMASTTAAELHARMDEAAPGGFATYAAAAGAESLDQLMEAAAAYMTFVEHRDQFSRPQLMNKMREAETHDTPREDRLRIFAGLLRDGKVVKVGGGRFIGTDKIGFQP